MKSSSMIFIDASAWVALFHQKDSYHQAAWKIYTQLLDEGKLLFLTTNWVAYETITILKNRASYKAAKSIWDILQDPELSQIVPIDKRLEKRALDLFWRYEDKTWGVVDCASMLGIRAK